MQITFRQRCARRVQLLLAQQVPHGDQSLFSVEPHFDALDRADALDQMCGTENCPGVEVKQV